MGQQNYRILGEGKEVRIELQTDQENQAQWIAAMGACQQGQCNCASDEYKKVADMAIEREGDNLRVSLTAGEGQQLDRNKIADCLEQTAKEIAGG